MNKKYRSEPLGAIYEAVEAVHAAGLLDKETMRRFDQACLMPVESLSGGQTACRLKPTAYSNPACRNVIGDSGDPGPRDRQT